ncbi:hypothetical protein ACSFBX_22275 [Variovorax sp. RB2P76]|uniref:hypothetical protein n=1 Tax=Variovorax sp. RB2P76 TaxID=3443736 RepID=UPI003F47E941
MPRQKKLNVGASEIEKWSVDSYEETGSTGTVFKRILLKIETADQVYSYRLTDSRAHATMSEAEEYLEHHLTQAKEDFSNVEIHEDARRTELTLKIQDLKSVIFEGKRLPN